MKQVSNNKFLKRVTLVAIACNIAGAILNILSKNMWTAVIFIAATVTTTFYYLDQLHDEE